jgi:hypothetical protein
MRDSWRPPPNPANPYFLWQLAGLAGQAADALAGEGGSFLALPGTGSTPNPVLDTARAYEIYASDGKGRYSGTPVTHRKAVSPTSADTFGEDETGRHGPGCTYDGFPLVEVTGRTDLALGAVVLAWPSPASDAMLFSAGAGTAVPVVAQADGPSVTCVFQTRQDGAWVDVEDLDEEPLTALVTVLDTDRNEPFVSGWRYWAFRAGPDGEWFSDTGEKTVCVENIVPGTLACDGSGGFSYETRWDRVFARGGCDAVEFALYSPSPAFGPPAVPAAGWRRGGGGAGGRHAGAAGDLTGGTTTMAVYTSQLGIA